MGEKEEKKVINEPSYCMLPVDSHKKLEKTFIFLKKVGPKLGISK